MSTTSTDTLVNRIAKLLALAGNNPSENEAALAAAKAAELMSEHNITLAQVALAQGDAAPAMVAGKRVLRVDTSKPWRVMLAQAVALSMDGKTVYEKPYGSRVVREVCTDPTSRYYGQKRNTDKPNPWFREGIIHFYAPSDDAVQAVVDIFTYLDMQLSLISANATAQGKRDHGIHGKSFRHNFLLGAVGRVAQRLREAHDYRNRSHGTALVLLRDVVNQAIKDDFGGGLSSGKGVRATHAGAYGDGSRAGGSVDLGGSSLDRNRTRALGSGR